MAAPAAQSSFIPKNTDRKQQRGSRKRVYVFSYVSYTVFFGTLLAAVGIFLYHSLLLAELDTKKAELDQEQSRFNDSDMLLVREFEHRITQAEARFANHVAVSGILSALAGVVVDEVQFTDFTLERLISGTAQVSVTAVSESFNALRFQQLVLKDSPVTDQAVVNGIEIGTSQAEESTDSDRDINATSMTIQFTVDATDIPYVPYRLPVTVPTVETSADSGSETGVSTNEPASQLEEAGDDSFSNQLDE